MKKLIILFSLLAVTTLHAQYKSVMVDTNGTLAGPTNFWTTNASQIRTTLNLGSAATNPATAFQPAATILSNLVWSGLTNTNSTNFLTDLGLYTTNSQALPDSKIWVGRVNSMGYQAMVTTNPLPYTANAAIALDGYHGLSFPAVATRDSLSAISRTNLGIGMSWITNTNTPVFYTVYTITETPEVRYGTNVRINTPDNFDFGGVGGTLQVEASNGNHAIAAKASDTDDGAAFYGWSASGAPAMKLVQSNYFNSPALTVWRPQSDGQSADYGTTPTVLVAGNSLNPSQNKALAIENQNGGGTVFWVNYDGSYPKHYTQAELSGSVIDWSLAETFYRQLSGNTSFSFSNVKNGQVIIVVIVNTGSYTVSWPTSGANDVKWAGGTAPTQTANGTDLYTFSRINGVIYGSVNKDMQ